MRLPPPKQKQACFPFTAFDCCTGRLISAKKPAGKLGLGVKKLDTKVDDSMFEQAPSEPPVAAPAKPTDPLSTAGGGGTSPVGPDKSVVAPVGSRFAYDAIGEVSQGNIRL